MVAVGEDYTLALKADGTVWAWGRNTWGQLGIGYGTVGGVESAPVQLRFTKIEGYQRPADLEWDENRFHLEETYSVAGYKRRMSEARITSELNALRQYTPIYSSQKKIVKIAAGMDFAMAIDSDGTVYTWGRNTAGQIGNGSKSLENTSYSEQYYPTPVTVEYFRELRNSADPESPLRIVDIATGVQNGQSLSLIHI